VSSLIVIVGPCLLESEQLGDEVASELVKIRDEHKNVRFIFKASIDKANRSSIRSARGLGWDAGLKVMATLKKRYNMEVTSDFHDPRQAESLAEVCDVVQVPAFLCRQTDVLAAAARTGRTVSVKKGQFLAPWDMKYVVEKLHTFGAKEIFQLERGTSFGYGNLVVDMRSFPIMSKNGHPVIYDVTHSLQLPGKGGETTAGAREFADTLALAAIGAGVDGLFLETHPRPAEALCDAETQLPLKTLADCLRQYITFHSARSRLCHEHDSAQKNASFS
jgi:2-dehydro-3-deoxyphosphooctonate aldolase (KDO 8-P synthase)